MRWSKLCACKAPYSQPPVMKFAKTVFESSLNGLLE